MYVWEAPVRTWRPTPVDAVIRVGDASTNVAEFDRSVGAGFREGNVDMRLIAALPHQEKISSGSSSFGKAEYVFKPTSSGETVWCFMCQPERSPALEITLLDATGQVLETANALGQGAFVYVSAHTHWEKVARIRVTYARSYRSVVFHLPELPGLPEENRNIKDLSAMRIPYAHFKTGYASELLRCKPCVFGGGTPAKVSLTFQNATVGTMLQVAVESEGSRVRVNGDVLEMYRPFTQETFKRKFKLQVRHFSFVS
jgi:hypothetical protein